jgi:SAM-dependent methyltransferase
MTSESQTRIDADNAAFWEELCGSSLARSIGVTDASPASLRRFDEAYLSYYSYLTRYLEPVVRRRGRALEIGLGYGTVSSYLAEAGVDYCGLDVAQGPVQIVRDRLDRLGKTPSASKVLQGSALAIPWEDGYFDALVSIGCLHHTGDLARGIEEVHRVLAPGGVAVVMVYNHNSLRQLLVLRPRAALKRRWGDRADHTARAAYDANAAGEPAPFTEFTSVRGARNLFSAFREVRIARNNMEPITPLRVPREKLLGWPARLLGLDLYITAVK